MLHRHRGLPDCWLKIVEENVAVWPLLDADERECLETTSDWLLRHKHWEAAHGFELTDDITVTIAAQASLLILGLSVDEYRELSAIIVYPSSMLTHGVRAGPARGTATDGDLPILGEACDRRGPVLIAWDEAEAAARNLGNGHNVVLHELAHKLDMTNGLLNGTPPLGGRVGLDRWQDVCTEAFAALAAGRDRPPLQPYGATNPAEFFAVATEAFFDVPVPLRAHEPDLYEILSDFYQQDPGARVRS